MGSGATFFAPKGKEGSLIAGSAGKRDGLAAASPAGVAAAAGFFGSFFLAFFSAFLARFWASFFSSSVGGLSFG